MSALGVLEVLSAVIDGDCMDEEVLLIEARDAVAELIDERNRLANIVNSHEAQIVRVTAERAKLVEAVEFATDMLAAGDVSEGTRVRVYVALHNALPSVGGAS